MRFKISIDVPRVDEIAREFTAASKRMRELSDSLAVLPHTAAAQRERIVDEAAMIRDRAKDQAARIHLELKRAAAHIEPVLVALTIAEHALDQSLGTASAILPAGLGPLQTPAVTWPSCLDEPAGCYRMDPQEIDDAKIQQARKGAA
jgi:hypothetical protein